MLDNDLVCTYYASDTALPGSEHQPVHPDVKPFFTGLAITLPPVNYVLDIPLVDFTRDNGPLEIWPQGTHLVPDSGALPIARSARDSLVEPVKSLLRLVYTCEHL